MDSRDGSLHCGMGPSPNLLISVGFCRGHSLPRVCTALSVHHLLCAPPEMSASIPCFPLAALDRRVALFIAVARHHNRLHIHSLAGATDSFVCAWPCVWTTKTFLELATRDMWLSADVFVLPDVGSLMCLISGLSLAKCRALVGHLWRMRLFAEGFRCMGRAVGKPLSRTPAWPGAPTLPQKTVGES